MTPDKSPRESSSDQPFEGADIPDDFTPIAPNPFIVGNPVRNKDMFFGREAEFEWVRNRFQDQELGSLLIFCGERRSGKTSILFQILAGQLGPSFIPVLIDMQSMAIENEADFLGKISQELLGAVRGRKDSAGDAKAGSPPAVPDYSLGSKPSALFKKFVEELLTCFPSKKLVLLFDEYELFEDKIEGNLLTQDVLHILANLMEHRSIFVVFTGSQNLEARRREYWGILRKSQHRAISYLQKSDAVNLMTRPVEGRVRYEDGVLESVYRLTAGQPFYTQAVCQNLIDYMNEEKTRNASKECLESVVRNIVSTPLPQMIFLWDGLAREEKLVMALLAETLKTPDGYARVKDLEKTLEAGKYRLDLPAEQMKSSLEKLFKQEMLLKDMQQVPGYAFRMDLWRLWIHRMHSVWQVMREEGIAIRGRSGISLPPVALFVGIPLLVGGIVLVGFLLQQKPNKTPARSSPDDSQFLASKGSQAGALTGRLRLEAEPPTSTIYREGNKVAAGYYEAPLEPAVPQSFAIRAAGYVDTTFQVTVAASDSVRKRIVLRPRTGSLRIETKPPGGHIEIDGRKGTSPFMVAGLNVPESHTVKATIDGMGSMSREVRVKADTVSTEVFDFMGQKVPVTITTNPAGAHVKVDGTAIGVTDQPLAAQVGMGSHRFLITHPGYVTLDSTVTVGQDTPTLSLTLRSLPPGELTVKGDIMAYITINNTPRNAELQNSKEVLPEGSYNVHVELRTGAVVVDTTIFVGSNERVVYDYSERKVTRASRK